MKRLTFALIILLIFGQSCGLLNQAGEYERFVNSNFSLVELDVLEIGGVELSEIDEAGEMDAGEMLTLVGRMFSGNLPAKLEAIVEVENTAGEKAAISGLEWRLLMKDVEYANGIVDQEVEVEAYSKNAFPVKAEIDLISVLQSESLPQILTVVFNINDKEELKKLDIEFKIKPFYKSGGKIKEYPGFITIRP